MFRKAWEGQALIDDSRRGKGVWLRVRASGALGYKHGSLEIWCESSKIDYQNSLDNDNAMVSASQSGVGSPKQIQVWDLLFLKMFGKFRVARSRLVCQLYLTELTPITSRLSGISSTGTPDSKSVAARGFRAYQSPAQRQGHGTPMLRGITGWLKCRLV